MSVTTVDDWTGEEYTKTPKVTNDTQPLLWNCNDGQLYWSWLYNPDGNWWVSATIYQISMDDWKCNEVASFFDDPVIARMPAIWTVPGSPPGPPPRRLPCPCIWTTAPLA